MKKTFTFLMLFFAAATLSAQSSCGKVKDYDGNTYNTVQIGKQCWMKENLRTTHFADGTPIPAGGDNHSDTAPYYYDYNSSDLPLDERGYLYNWLAAMHGAASSDANPSGVQGACPTGWHLPSNAEWTVLEESQLTQEEIERIKRMRNLTNLPGENACKLSGSDKWCSSSNDNVPGDFKSADQNASGFSAVPAGSCYGSSFKEADSTTYFWSSSMRNGVDGIVGCGRFMSYRFPSMLELEGEKSCGFSVRCLRDEVQSTKLNIDVLKSEAKCGDANAQFKLGKCYYYGKGTKKNKKKAISLYTKSAKNGNVEAQTMLGECYFFGSGTKINEEKAAYWYSMAAQQGDALAQYNLGVQYEQGLGVEESITEAVYWYTKAAEQGFSSAQRAVGFCYKYGDGVDMDEKKAIYWFSKAANYGDVKAQNQLANCYFKGEGVPKDNRKALYWAKQAYKHISKLSEEEQQQLKQLLGELK